MSPVGDIGLRCQPKTKLKGNKRPGAAVRLPEGRVGRKNAGEVRVARPPVRSPTAPECPTADGPNQGPQYLPPKGNDRGRWRPRKCRRPHVADLELWTPRIYPAPINLVGLVMKRSPKYPSRSRNEQGRRETAGGGRAARGGGDTIYRASRRTPHGRTWGPRSASPPPAVLLMACRVADAFLYDV